MGLDVRGDDIIIFSDDSKAAKLEEQYGAIFGVTDESKDEVRPELIQGTARLLRLKLKLP